MSDVVISLDPSNKFPTKDKNDHHSQGEFTTDSIVITKEILARFVENGHYVQGKIQAYIGVYTEGPMSIYSILSIVRTKFTPIKLALGQIQTGMVAKNEKKYYYYQSNSPLREKDMQPITIDLVPTNGNSDLEITLISNLTVAKSVWHQMSQQPNWRSQNRIGLDSVVLDPKTNRQFFDTCQRECVILIAVTAP
jgi:hypothetical protein